MQLSVIKVIKNNVTNGAEVNGTKLRKKPPAYVLWLDHRIQESRSVPRSLDPVDKPRDVGIGLNIIKKSLT
jgi:hypothetical protein